MATLYLVDGTYNVFRAYHATPRLTNSAGLPTNAVYAFTNMLRKLVSDERPTYLLVLFDTGKPTKRHEVFKDYKANRPPPPDDLLPQLRYIDRVCEVLRVPVMRMDGYEADDLMATLAEKATAAGHEIVLVTSDKDLYQLVRSGVKVLNPMKENRLMDEAAVVEIFGVRPDQVADVLALMGDASDNIPGVPGIGEKGAKEIVRRFGSLEEAARRGEEEFAAIGRMGRKYWKALRENLEQAMACRGLATVWRDVPVDLDLAALKTVAPDREAAYALFRELEFSSLMEGFAPRAEGALQHRTIGTLSDLESFLEAVRADGLLAVDTKTATRDPMRAELVGIALCSRAGGAAYVPLGHTYLGCPEQIPVREALQRIGPLLEDEGLPKIAHNAKHEIVIFRRHGIHLRGLAFDSMVASYLIDPSRDHAPGALARDYLGYRTITYEDVAGTGSKQATLDNVDVETVARYAAENAEVALRLRSFMSARLRDLELEELYEGLELPLVSILASMELAGVRVDPAVLAPMAQDLHREMQRLEKEIFEMAGMSFNINSTKQLGDVLFGKLELDSRRKTTKSKARSTSQEVLEELSSEHPLPAKVLEYRSLAKLKGTYVDALPALINPATGRVHTSINQTVAATGRLSSSDPNLQNIPIRTEVGRRIRAAFVPEPGSLLVAADYSQVELRILAHMADDPDMQDAFRRDEDIHRRTAAQIFGIMPELVSADQRRQAKTINFGVLYGMGPVRLARELGIPRKSAADFIEQYFARFPRVKEYMDVTVAGLERNGYVTTLFNRRRYFPEIRTHDRMLIQQALRAAVNSTIQGTAADIIKRAMIDLEAALRSAHLRTRMILQVHDELVLEAPEEELEQVRPMVKRMMEGAAALSAPLVAAVKTGRSWMEVTG
jgi:DNA polymerase-1